MKYHINLSAAITPGEDYSYNNSLTFNKSLVIDAENLTAVAKKVDYIHHLMEVMDGTGPVGELHDAGASAGGGVGN